MTLKRLSASVFAGLLVAGLALPALIAQTDFDTAVLGALHWRLLGSFRGGRVSAVAGVPGDARVYYFGTPGGGIWKTSDGGHVWEPVFDKERVASVGALAVAPSDGKIVYAGTGEQTPGNGVYRSNDEGKTWAHVGLEDTRFIQAVIVDPKNPDVVVAGVNSIGVYLFSHPYPTRTFLSPRGVFKTADGGKTWKQTLVREDSAGVFDMTADPDDGRVLYASVFLPASKKDGRKEDDSVLYKSTDEGSTWDLLAVKGLPEKGRGRLGISVAAGTHGSRLYAVMEQGFYRSDDAGATWTQSTHDPRIVGNAYFSRVFSDTKRPDVLYVAQTSMYRSTDGGKTFEAYVGAPSGDDFHVLWIDPVDPARMLLGVDQGAIITVDGGATWGSWYNQPTGQFYHITSDNEFPYRTYAAQQDSGTQSVPSRSDNGEITPADVSSIGGFEFCYIAPDPLHPDWIYSGGWYGTVVRYDRKTGQTATVFERGEKNRTTQMPPLFFSKHDPGTLYFATQFVLKTTDEGKTWQRLSPDLTGWDEAHKKELAEKEAKEKAEKAKGVKTGKKDEDAEEDRPRPPAIEALAESPVDGKVLWAATGNRLVQVTRDGGAHWQAVTPKGVEKPAEILYVEASHFDAGEAFLTVGSSRQLVAPQVLRTRDFGASWETVINGLPGDESVRVVREDPVRRGLLYAGTDSTVYLSYDDGEHWHPLTLNLPASPVTDIEAHGDDLTLSTYGRGLWILDDLAPIRQLTPELLAKPAELLKPETALRVRWDTYQDTPLPVETPTAKNPPDGVLLDYYLRADATDKPTITIRDGAGNVVRSFSGVTPEPSLPLPNVPEYWFAKPGEVAGSAGLHRFVWDLRYAPPKALPASYYGPILQYTEYTLADHAIPGETPRQQPQGPLVVPGEYTVELTTGGEAYTQALTVKIDPRVHVFQSDLEAQLAAARRVAAGMEASYDAYQQVTALTGSLGALDAAKNGQKVDTDELEKKIKAVSDGTNERPGLGPVNRDLGRLYSSVEAGDQRPTEPQMVAVEEKCASVTKVMGLWKELNEGLKLANPLKLPVAGELAVVGCGE